MQKKIVRKILCIGMLCVALIFGCGQTQSEGEALEAAEAEKTGDKTAFELSENTVQEDEAQSETDASELLGTWSLTFDCAKAIKQGLSDDYADFYGEFDLTVYLTFYDDNTCELYVDIVEVEPALQSYWESLARFSADDAYSELEETGYTKEESDILLKKIYGMDVYDYFLEQYSSIMSADFVAEQIYAGAVYEVKGNELHLDKYAGASYGYDIFRIEGDTLTMMPPENVEIAPTLIEGFDYPYVFTRVE